MMVAGTAMVCSFGIFNPAITSEVSAASTNYLGETLSLSNVQSVYNVGDIVEVGGKKGVIIPSVTTAGDYTIAAKNMAGQVCDSSTIVKDTAITGKTGTYNFFAPDKLLGTYVLTFTTVNGDVKTSKDVTITFAGDTPKFKFNENPASADIIPSSVNPGASLRFVFPDIEMSNGEVISATDTHGTKGTTTIKLIDPKANEVSINGDNGNTAMLYTVPTTDTVYGTYTVVYTYVAENGYSITTSEQFTVVSQTREVELSISSFSSDTDSIKFEVGVETTLPQPTVINKKDGNREIEAHTDIKIQYRDGNEWKDEATVTNFKFTPTKAGQYRMDYVVKAFYGEAYTQHVGKESNLNASLTSSSLKMAVVTAYTKADLDQMEMDEILDASYMIPTKIATDADEIVKLPAIYGRGYNNANVVYKRTISGPATAEITQDATSLGEYKFAKAGTYTVRYEVSYPDNGPSIHKDYKVVVEDSFTHTATPVVNLLNVPATASKGETFVVNVEAFDYDANKTIVDNNLAKNVYYYFSGNPTPQVAKYTSEGYEITVPADCTDEYLEVYANAENDFATNGQTSKYRVRIKSNSTDKTAPTLTFDSGFAFDATWGEKVRGTEVELPAVDVADDTSPVQLNIVVSKNGSVVKDFTLYDGDSVINVAEGDYKFTLGEAGTYDITYIATDANDNITVQNIQVNSTSDSKPSIKMNIGTSAEYGETINVYSKINTYLDGDLVRYTPVMVTMPTKLDNETDDSFRLRVNQFVAAHFAHITESTLLIGITGNADILGNESIRVRENVMIQAWAANHNGSVTTYEETGSEKVTINVADNTKPVFDIIGGVAPRSQEFFTTETLPSGKTLEEANTVVIPWFDAATINDGAKGYLGSGINLSTLKVVVKYKDSSTTLAEFTAEDADNENTVVATKVGKIVATYSVEDNAGNLSTKEVIFNIGDVTPPEIDLGDLDLTEPQKTSDEPFEIDLSGITITEHDSEMTYKDLDITIKRDGTEVDFERSSDESKIELDISTAGTYTIEMKCTDEAGNTSEIITKSFVVSAETATPTNSTTVWGTVLIVLSLLVLGGVIYFFVKPSKSKTTLSTTTKKDKK